MGCKIKTGGSVEILLNGIKIKIVISLRGGVKY